MLDVEDEGNAVLLVHPREPTSDLVHLLRAEEPERGEEPGEADHLDPHRACITVFNMPANLCGVSTQGAFPLTVNDDLRPIAEALAMPEVTDPCEVTDPFRVMPLGVVDDCPLRRVNTVGCDDPPPVEVNARTTHATTCHSGQGRWPAAKHAKPIDRKSTRLNSSHSQISYAVFCLKKKKQEQ